MFKKLFNLLIKPSSLVVDNEKHIKVVILSSILLVSAIVMLILSLLVAFWIGKDIPIANHLIPISIATLILIGAYLLSRSRYYRIAGYVACFSLWLSTISASFVDPKHIIVAESLPYTALMVTIAALTLGRISATIFASLAVFSASILPIIQPALKYNMVLSTIIFLIGSSSLTILFVSILSIKIKQLQKSGNDLRESANQFRKLAEASFDGIVFMDKGVIIEANEPFAKMYGYTHEEVIGMNIAKFIDSESLDIVVENIKNNSREVQETVVLKKDGTKFLVETNGINTTYQGGNVRMTAMRDVSEEKKLEKEKEKLQKQVFQKSKLESIGELAAGVGHEINNPLAIIQGYIEKIGGCYKKKIPDLIEPLKIIENSVDRIKNIVEGLRTYARMDTGHIQVIDIHKIINDSISLIGFIFKQENIKIESLYKANNSEVNGNIGKFQQVIMNLFSNSKDAFNNKGGIIKIETKNNRNNLILKFSDDGAGIKKENLDNIFNTFFTTKEVGKGTGLGLGISYKIIDSMNGKISVDSEYGIGTQFTLTLPIAGKENLLKDEDVEVGDDEDDEDGKLRGKVLVVDDEDDFRDIICENLKEFGLEVDDANSGEIALEKIKKNKYDYIITDLKMPKVNGEKLVQEARRLGGNEKIIVMTGGIVTEYTKEQRHALRELANGYLKKPFRIEEIYEAFKKS